jgi:hypothetical protein
MAGIITYPWARPHGYNPKKKKKRKQQASNKLDNQSQR